MAKSDGGDACAGKRGSIGARRNPATEVAILDAAGAIVDEGGIGALTMEAVARRARAGKATVYRWWPTRGALLLAVYERQKQTDGYPDTGTLEGDMAAVLRLLFAYWKRPEGALFRHIVAAAQSDPELAEALETFRKERLASLTEVIGRTAARGELAQDLPVADMARAVMAMAWLHLLTGQLDADPVALARVLVRGWGHTA
ncbi:TetR/AcrR family transcriptional regulator [Pseudodonghicola xiamenensis]|uniref:TetR family transcriptional regulator n=1 Tax=Pseudodonghicola xiamenensis TaxID=337702 RepID=A0A8J3MF16_9RHOB|nr:TetR/AcrR family transcriptional regulator [Pseudodonghicola xiamenensis]GHH01344.1 TetR family transcriptional regulator [Pseudodonghicola xiamenensis]